MIIYDSFMVLSLNKKLFMKRGSTHFLRFVIILFGLGVLAICIFALPSMWQAGPLEFPGAGWAIRMIMVGLYLAAIPFYLTLCQTFKLLSYIDQNIAFSELSTRALRNIKYCAAAISILFIAFVPLFFPIAQADDAPGLIIFASALACAPIAIAVFAAILERLLRDAILIKSENELTV